MSERDLGDLGLGNDGSVRGERIDCTWLLADPGSEPALPHSRLTIEDGRIAAVAPQAAWSGGKPWLALPALSNAHDHARTFRTATLGAFDRPLESWLPFQGLAGGLDPYLCAATSFARSVRHGVANLMVHYTRVQGGTSFVDETAAVARAARDVGVRIGFAVALRDRNGIGYCDDATMLAALRPQIRDAVSARLSVRPVPPAEQLAQVDEAARRIQADGGADHVTVQYGPTAVQWCSTPLLEAIAQASADHARPVHMHLLETSYQRAWADAEHPQGIVRFLDDLGLLTPRLTLAHCAWARPDELALIAERGATIAVNTSSNLWLRSGIAPVAEMLRQGCRVAMGLDGSAFDDDDDALRELRLAYALHRGWGFETTMTREQLWAFSARHGRRVVRGAAADGDGPDVALGARLAPGEPADLLLLDWSALDDDALFPEVDPLDLLLARGTGRHIDQVFVGGRRVVDGARVLGIDEVACKAELLAQARSMLGSDAGGAAWRDTLRMLADDLGPFYRRAVLGGFGGCC